MNLKKSINCCYIGLFLLAFALPINAQKNLSSSSKNHVRVKKHTVLGQFEPELVLSSEERLQLKSERIATLEKRREIIDTLDISDRKRRQLLKELYSSPFSYKWDKVITEIELEDEPEEDQ